MRTGAGEHTVTIPLRQYWILLRIYLKPAWLKVTLLTILLFANTGLLLVNPLLLRRFLDSAQRGDALTALTRIAATFIGVAVVAQILGVCESYVAEDVGWTATNRLRGDLMRHVLDLDMGFHTAHVPGELTQRIDYDVSTLANFFSRFILRVVASLLLLLGVLVVLFGINPVIGVTFAGFVVIALVALRSIQRVIVPFAKVDLQTVAALFGYLEERLTGTEDIRSRGAIDHVLRGLYGHMRARMRARRNADLMYTALLGMVGLLTAIGTALAYALGGSLFRHGAITIGTVFAVVSYIALVIAPLNQLTQQVQDLQQATAGIIRVQELLDTSSAIQDGRGASLPVGALSVTCTHLSFDYRQDAPVLDDLSFTVAPGTVLGILGRTGSGKSTLARLLVRLYDPTHGSIQLGDVDLRDTRQREIRQRVGLVTQEVQLFHGSIRDNVTLFDPAVPEAQILQAFRDLGLWDWYTALPAGLETELAGGDAGLSAGEAQLLAFARVFLRDPGLVILDEASSRLDPTTERRIERAVDVLLRGRTGIIVAHRLGTVERAQAILILDDGRIVEQGRRESLAADPTSRYAGLRRTGLAVMP